MSSRLIDIKQYGQKIWIDNISRELIESGLLNKLIEEDGIAGITSNPTIFHKAISSDNRYKNDLIRVQKTSLDLESRYEALVIPDIQAACDILLPLYTQSKYEDGYVSFELSPSLAKDAKATVNNALRLWSLINRPNLMIKVPATSAGIEALEELISMGLNVNITLLFSLKQVMNTWQAYIRGLTNRYDKGLDIDKIKAVASFFLSRIDAAIDPQLPKHLQGKTAINLAKAAYLKYKEIFSGQEFQLLKSKGAKGQHLLWASTGTKNPNYSDVLYIEELIGPDTINTVPDATLNAFRDHGVAAQNLSKGIDKVKELLTEVTQYSNIEEIGENLQQEGLALFESSFENLLELVK